MFELIEYVLLVKRTIFDYDPESWVFLQVASPGGDVTFSVLNKPKVTFDGGDKIAFVLTNEADLNAVKAVIDAKPEVTIIGKGDDYEVESPEHSPA